MKKNVYIFGLSLLLMCLKLQADPIISFFFKPLADVQKVIKKLTKPGNLAKNTVNSIIQPIPVAGILVAYSGYLATSNDNGEVILPRKHSKSEVIIAITPEMIPIPLFDNTYNHWNFISDIPAKMYMYEQKYDEDKDQSYWNIKELPITNNHIPPAAIIIIAKPKDIFINSGITSTVKTANLILPDIYVKKGINIIKNSCYMLTIRHLFKPVHREEKFEPFKIITQVID